MTAFRTSVSFALLINLTVAQAVCSAIAQTAAPKDSQTAAPGSRKLSGDDAGHAQELEKAIKESLAADRCDEAVARAEELLALRTRILGREHFESLDEEWRVKTLRRVASLSREDRAAYLSSQTATTEAKALLAVGKHAQAQALFEKSLETCRRLLTELHPETATAYNRFAASLRDQGKYALAQPPYEKALQIRRSLLGDDHPATAQSYNNVAVNLNAQGQYALAQPLFEKSLEIRRRLLTNDHPETLQSYRNLAGNLDSLGRYAQAQPLYEKALEIGSRLFGDDNLGAAMSYNNLAANLNRRGKYGEAQPLFEKALEIRRRLLTDDHPATAGSYNNLAQNLSAQGKYTQAQPLCEKALEIRRRKLTEDHPDTAASYNNLAAILNAQGRYVQAQPLYEKALRIRRRRLGDDHPDTAQSYNNLAFNLNHQGEYARAQPLYEKALEIRRRLLTDDHPATAGSYNNMAVNLNDQGKHSQAQPLCEKALEIYRRLLTEEHPLTATSYSNLALNLSAQKKYAEAQLLFEKALEIRLRVAGDQPEAAIAYNNVAVNLGAQGKYRQAQPLCEKALEIDRRLFGDDHPHTAERYNSLAANLNSQGKYAEAQPFHEKALAVVHRLHAEDQPNSANIHAQLASNLQAQGKYASAHVEWERAVKGLDSGRLRLAFAGLDRAGGLESARPQLAAVLARLGKPVEAWQALEADLGRGLLDELAARQDRRLAPDERDNLHALAAELERLERLVEITPTALDQAGRAKRFEDLQRQRARLSVAIGELQSKLVNKYGPLAGQVAGLKAIQSSLPGDAALITWVDIPPVGPGAADPDGEHWAVIVRSEGAPVWVPIAGSGPSGLWTGDDFTLAQRARSGLRDKAVAGSTKELATLVEKLRVQRLDPIAKALGTTAHRLIVLPSRSMAGVPLEALLAPDDVRTVSYAPSGSVFKYLREQSKPGRRAGLLALGDPVFARPDSSSEPEAPPEHGLLVKVVLPGSNAAIHGFKPDDVLVNYNGTPLKSGTDLKVVAAGDKPIAVLLWRNGSSVAQDVSPGKLGLVVDPRPAPLAIAEQRKLQKVLVAARGGGEDFAPLPGTRSEVEAIAQLFKADDRPIRVLVDAAASEAELDRLAASGELAKVGFIHLATHGVIDEDVPTRSAVILTQTGLPDPLEQALENKPVYDGRLLVREIQHGWDLKAELVTLSACETALGRDLGGEGFVGFTQALLMSGARSVCLSLWKVDDTATALLMQRFYANLLGRRTGLAAPLPKAEALGEAKKWLRQLRRGEVLSLTAELSSGVERGKGSKARAPALIPAKDENDRPYESPHYWAAFVLAGDPD